MPCLTSSIRLVGGANDLEGTVEIYHNGSWGTVCDDFWDLNDGNIVCRMLGHVSSTSIWGNAFFGEGNGEIILPDISCTGTESDLCQCSHSDHGYHNCAPSEAAGVTCSPGMELILIFKPLWCVTLV